ncbi:MAG: hypothetical protein GQ564_02245 [Bacteroidales bacterium]|nr:hypothetical protein [Bacteroidales bacterium]
MILNYKTAKLPPNFIALGYILFGISAWRIAVLDWTGIIFLVISILCLFIKSGLIIDSDNKRLKKYNGIFTIRRGEWKDISTLTNLQIIKTKASQSMNVLSINRTVTIDFYKLILILPNKKIVLMAGKKDYITNTAEEISKSLQTKVLN